LCPSGGDKYRALRRARTRALAYVCVYVSSIRGRKSRNAVAFYRSPMIPLLSPRSDSRAIQRTRARGDDNERLRVPRYPRPSVNSSDRHQITSACLIVNINRMVTANAFGRHILSLLVSAELRETVCDETFTRCKSNGIRGVLVS